ncbi:hypothetical protein ACRRTK_024461 [Alexandromys fortis]
MEQWRQCGRWLIDCKVLPPNHRVVWPSAVVFDLAQALRDGVLLCQLLHNLSPGSIDLKDINFRPQMSQVRVRACELRGKLTGAPSERRRREVGQSPPSPGHATTATGTVSVRRLPGLLCLVENDSSLGVAPSTAVSLSGPGPRVSLRTRCMPRWGRVLGLRA